MAYATMLSLDQNLSFPDLDDYPQYESHTPYSSNDCSSPHSQVDHAGNALSFAANHKNWGPVLHRPPWKESYTSDHQACHPAQISYTLHDRLRAHEHLLQQARLHDNGQSSSDESLFSFAAIVDETLSNSSDSSYGECPPSTYYHHPHGWTRGLGYGALGYLQHPVPASINPYQTLHNVHDTVQNRVSFDTADASQRKVGSDPATWLSGQGSRRVVETASTWVPKNHTQLLPPSAKSNSAATDSDSDYKPTPIDMHPQPIRHSAPAKVAKRRSAKASTTKRSQQPDKITKSRKSLKAKASASKAAKKTKARTFSCPLQPYGCHASFLSKNEWKRHFTSQHLSSGFYRCDLCDDSDTNPNDFNRKDLFQQHLKRMHGGGSSKATPLAKKACNKSSPVSGSTSFSQGHPDYHGMSSRCWVPLHDPPTETCCVFCAERFTGPTSCKEWLEHVGKHLSDLTREESHNIGASIHWKKDETLRGWLLEVGTIVPTEQGGLWQLVDDTVTADVRARAFAKRQESTVLGRDDAEGDIE